MAKVNFTAGRISDYKCESDKKQSFLWDAAAPGLGLRATALGTARSNEAIKAGIKPIPFDGKSYIFQAKLRGQAIRITIGSPSTWAIDAAQAEARRLKVLIDEGKDPRQVKSEQQDADNARREGREQAKIFAATTKIRKSITLGQVWPVYIDDRKVKSKWSAGHLHNHHKLADLGGNEKKRGEGLTKAAPLAPLMPLALTELTSERIAAWLTKESGDRPTNAAQSYRLLRAFIRWAAESPEYSEIIPDNAYTARIVRDAIPESHSKEGDCMQREQLSAWFKSVRNISNPVVSAYFQALLLTGARRRELSSLRWEDVDFQWNSLTIRDKVEGTRIIPLTPYVSNLLTSLSRRNEWVFSSPTAGDGRLTEPRIAHNQALEKAGLPHLTLHGLRRSFGTLCEWVEMPTGISAQIMGHKPSALAEKHYRRRPLDLLRVWHVKIESWMLEQAKVDFVPAQVGLPAVN